MLPRPLMQEVKKNRTQHDSQDCLGGTLTRSSAQNVLHCEQVGDANDMSRLRNHSPLADNPAATVIVKSVSDI